jgi:Fe-S cluster assembly protein SufD
VNASAPRLLIVAGAGASVEVVEEYAPASDNSAYFTNSVAEVEVGDGASVTHGYVQLEGSAAMHFKTTLVRQLAGSRYELTEAALGAQLARHDLAIQQVGGG